MMAGFAKSRHHDNIFTSIGSVPGNEFSGKGDEVPGVGNGGAGVVEFDDIELVTVGIRTTSSAAGVGPFVDESDGGVIVGSKSFVGNMVGFFEGADEGFAKGAADGGVDGVEVGALVGLAVGGADVGE